MERLITNLDTNLGPVLREQLNDNFKKIQDGATSQSGYTDKQILDMLGDVPLQDKNEVTQSRIDANGKKYLSLKTRLDIDQETAETALEEERKTSDEVKNARVSNTGNSYYTIKDRLDDQEDALTNDINDKLSQISVIPETFANVNDLKSKYPNGKGGLFVTADNGHKYIWTNSQWQDAGVYQSSGISDIEKNSVVSKALSVNDYIDDGDLIGATLNDITPYYISNPNAAFELKQNVFGKNWVRISGSKSSYIGGIVDIDLSNNNSYRVSTDTIIKFLVHNNISTFPLTVIVNAFDASNNLVDSYKPILDDAHKTTYTYISWNETAQLSIILPALTNIFSDNYQKITKLSLNFVCDKNDIDVDFLLTGASAKPVNYHVSPLTELIPEDKMAVENFVKSQNFIKNGNLITPNSLPIWGNSSKEVTSWGPNFRGRNWINLYSIDTETADKGFAFQYMVNTPETSWRKDAEAVVSVTVMKNKKTLTSLHLGAHVYVNDDSSVLARYQPQLSSGTDLELSDSEVTVIKFKIPRLDTLTNVVPTKVVIALFASNQSELLDIAVTNISVTADNDTYLSNNILTNEQKQQGIAYEEDTSYVKGGKLTNRNTGCYGGATGKEGISYKKFKGDNWAHYLSSDKETAYKGMQIEWRLDGDNLYRLYADFNLSFDLVNQIDSNLVLTLRMFDQGNQLVKVYTPDVLLNHDSHKVDLNIFAPRKLIDVGSNVPVRMVLALNDPIASNDLGFYIKNLSIKPTVIRKIKTKTNLPELHFFGDFLNMTKDNKSKVRMTFVHSDGNFENSFAKMSWQGNSSLNYKKKNYKIRLYKTEDFDEKDSRTFFADIKASKKFNIKANWVDATHARNIVSSKLVAEATSTRTDLLKNLAEAENFSQIQGHPVNLFANGKYIGLFTFNTTKGENMFNMSDENQNEIAINAEKSSDVTKFQVDSATFDEGADFEFLSPDEPTQDAKDAVNRLLTFVNSASDEDFAAHVHEYLDVPSVIDYFIFMNVLQDADGVVKNATYYSYDKKIWSAVAYDLDSTWGLHWDGAYLLPYDQNMLDFSGNKLFIRISKVFKDDIKTRYFELRNSVFSSYHIIESFTNFINDVGEENYNAEQALYTNVPSANLTDIQQIREAVTQRLAALDKQIRYNL